MGAVLMLCQIHLLGSHMVLVWQMLVEAHHACEKYETQTSQTTYSKSNEG